MSTAARETYLATQVKTASPQQLHLMLLDGAIRFARSAERNWAEDREAAGREAIDRCYAIVVETLTNVAGSKTDVSRNLVRVYLYLFQMVSELRHARNEEKMADFLRVLAVEQQTWARVCDKFGSHAPAAGPHAQTTPARQSAESRPEGVSFEA